jgi:hypothetical protein
MTIRPRAIAAVCALPLTLGTTLLAWEPPLTTRAHVRPLTADARALVTAGGGRSASIRELIDRLEVSDLVVYVDVRWFSETRSGRLAFVGSAAGSRYVIIQIACGQIGSDQLVALGHELRHAVEVADAGEVVDRQTFSRLYQRLGVDVGGIGGNRQFETRAAIDAGRRVRHELFTRSSTDR